MGTLVQATRVALSALFVRGALALVLTVGLVILLVGEKQVPDAYWGICGTVIGFYFGRNLGTPDPP